jgi:hypothetical protein
MTFLVQSPDEEEEMDEEAEPSLDDDLLAELDPLEDELVDDPLSEGFGEVTEDEEKAIETAVLEPTESEEEGDESLEEDAEDVDFDTFDDVDEI